MIHTNCIELRGFPFTLRTNTVGHIWESMADRVSRRGRRKTVQFRGMFVWIIELYFYNIFLPIMHFITNSYRRLSKTNSADPMCSFNSVCLFPPVPNPIFK